MEYTSRDDSLRKIFENRLTKPIVRLLNGKQVVKRANQLDVPSIVKLKTVGKSNWLVVHDDINLIRF